MTSKAEHASLSAFVYNDQRGGGGLGSDTNRLDLPIGWTDIATASGFTGNTINSNPASFTAGAFIKQSTGEIVVAYKGTDLLLELSGRAWNTVADMATNVSLYLNLGIFSAQQMLASSYYLAVKDWAVANGHDPAKISFTGHSLGGALAANMAVWFDRPATTFAEAPFQDSAANPLAILAAAGALTAQAGTNASVAILEEFAKLVALAVPGTFAVREFAVAHHYNQGEFLAYLRTPASAVIGTDTMLDLGPQTLGNALPLHSMNLHLAFMLDDRLRELAKTMPALLPALVDKKLHWVDPNSTVKDLVTSLVSDQIREGFANDSALKRFTTDIDKLKDMDGIAASASFNKALIAAAMDYYYDPVQVNTQPFFTATSGCYFGVRSRAHIADE